MKTLKSFPGIIIIVSIVFSAIIIANSNNCQAQKSLINNMLIVNIDKNSETINETNNLLLEQKSIKKIFKHFKLTKKEKELLNEVEILNKEAIEWEKEASNVSDDIIELKKIEELSKRFKDIKEKAERKALRYTKYAISLRYDAAECFEIRNSIIYQIFKNHMLIDKIILEDNKNTDEILELYNNAEEMFKKAIKLRDKAYNSNNNLRCLDFFDEAKKNELQAIDNQKVACMIYYNIPFEKNISSEQDTYFTDNKTNNNIVVLEEMDEIIIKNDVIEEAINNNAIDENLIYKIQIGAFLNTVSEDEFHGLTPLSVDDTNSDIYTKYMLGQYYSLRAANEARKIITNTTKHSDAFIVAYKNGVRVPIR